MDKRTLVPMVISMALIAGFLALRNYSLNKYPDPVPPAPAIVTPATQPSETLAATHLSTLPAAGANGWQIVQAPPGVSSAGRISLGSSKPGDPKYAMQLNLESRGAAISAIVLNGFKSSDDSLPVQKRGLYSYQSASPDVPGSAPFATRSVEINGVAIDVSGAKWDLETVDASAAAPGESSAAYSTTLFNNGAPSLKISKKYTVYPIDSKQGGKGYEVRLDYALQNLSPTALTVKTAFNGPTLPPAEGGRGSDRQIIAGYVNNKEIAVASHPVEEFKKDKQETLEVAKSDKGSLAWFGPCSVYFDAFVLPLSSNPKTPGEAGVGEFIEKATAQGWDYENKDLTADQRPVTLVVQTTGQQLAAGQTVTMPMDVYFGPKWRNVLNDPHYASFPRRYDTSLIVKSGFCAFCTFDWLIKSMVALLTAFHYLAGGFAGHGDWGIAIILLVAVVRLALHPITKKSQVQMMKMGKMGPEMERLKKKYADDKDELNKQMMQFYKAQGAAPILGCLPMFLQMPIWIALYSSLQTTFELRQSPFLWNLTWIHDLAQPDYLIHFSNVVELPFGLKLHGLNLLPILLGVVFFVQTKYMTPQNPAMTPEQLQQQKMMQWMTPFIFPVMLYTGPSGLNLYIFTSTFFGIVESKVIRRHIKEREEAEKAGRVIIDAKPTRAGKQLSRTDEPNETPKGGLMRMWASLQAKAEQVRQEQDRRGKNGRR